MQRPLSQEDARVDPEFVEVHKVLEEIISFKGNAWRRRP